MTTVIDRPSRKQGTKHSRRGANNASSPAVNVTAPSQILVVDDDTGYVDSLSDTYRVVAVRSGRVAVDRVKRRCDIDLAVVEYRLSDMSGIEVMKEIKDIAPSVLVIIVTAFGD